MENRTFYQKNKAYLLVGLALLVLTYWLLVTVSIMDFGYTANFILEIFKGNSTGQIVPFDSLSHYEQSEVGLFGPNYTAFAPEIIRAYIERNEFLFFVFIAEVVAFSIYLKVSGGRKNARITNPSDDVLVYSLFQRIVLLLNIIVMVYLFLTGFSITFGNSIGGGVIHRFLRASHEIIGVLWIPIWLVVTVIAFKDHKYFKRGSSKMFYKIFLKGDYHPMERLNYLAYVAFGFLLVLSGFLIWYIEPSASNFVDTIQLKRFLLYLHFGGSALISFFVFETVYTSIVAVKGYLPGLITGRIPKEYIEQLRPDLKE